MWNNNSVTAGLLLGCIFPAITWIIFGYVLHNDAIFMQKPAAPYLIAIVLNLLALRYCFRNNLENAANGIMMVTFAFMLVVFLFKIQMAS